MLFIVMAMVVDDIDRYIYVKENEDSNSARLNNFEEVKEKLLKLCDD